MNNINEAQRKRMIFDSMSPRRQKQIEKKGYDRWNPFQEPKDPINMRMDETRRTSKILIQDFFNSTEDDDTRGNEYRRGVFEFCMGIINEDEKYLGMFDFACWYREELKKRGLGIKNKI